MHGSPRSDAAVLRNLKATITLIRLVDEGENQIVEQLLLDERKLPEHSSRYRSAPRLALKQKCLRRFDGFLASAG